MQEKVLMKGNEAIAEAAIRCGCQRPLPQQQHGGGQPRQPSSLFHSTQPFLYSFPLVYCCHIYEKSRKIIQWRGLANFFGNFATGYLFLPAEAL